MTAPARVDSVRLFSRSRLTARAAARERNSTEKKPMTAGIWVKAVKEEA